MTLTLPAEVDARRLAAQASRIAGQIPASALIRISEAYSNVQPAQATLEFTLDGAGSVRVTGHFRTTVTAICQRCLEPVVVEIANDIECELERETSATETVASEKTSALSVNVIELIEDEILLAAPMIPMHDTTECHADEVVTALAQRAEHPFAMLGALRKNSG